MKQLAIISNSIKLSDKEIDFFELKYKIHFPSFFVDFLREYNGAETEEHIYSSDNIKYVVNNFLPLLENRNASIEQILPVVRDEEEDIGRSDLIPFAIDPGGRPYYVSIGNNDYSSVYIDRIGMGYSNPLLKIADSFEEFINGLRPENES